MPRYRSPVQKLRRRHRHHFRTVLPALWAAQAGLCCWCRGLTFLPADVPNMATSWLRARTTGSPVTPEYVEVLGERFPVATVEHVHELAAGGHPTARDNLAMACRPCNMLRASLGLYEFLVHVGLDPALLVEAGDPPEERC